MLNIINDEGDEMKTQAVIFPEANSYEITTLTLDEMGQEDVLVRTLTTAVSPGNRTMDITR